MKVAAATRPTVVLDTLRQKGFIELKVSLYFFSFKDDAKVFQEAIAIVACFATDLEVIRNQCAIEQLHVPVLKSIQMFPNDVTLIEMAFEAIGKSSVSMI